MPVAPLTADEEYAQAHPEVAAQIANAQVQPGQAPAPAVAPPPVVSPNPAVQRIPEVELPPQQQVKTSGSWSAPVAVSRLSPEELAQMEANNRAAAGNMLSNAEGLRAAQEAETRGIEDTTASLQNEMQKSEEKSVAALRAKEATERDLAQLEAKADEKVDPQRYFRNSNAWDAIGSAMAGLALGLGGRPDVYINHIHKMVENDIESQKSNQARALELVRGKREKLRMDQDVLNKSDDEKRVLYSRLIQNKLEALKARTSNADAKLRLQMGIDEFANKSLEAKAKVTEIAQQGGSAAYATTGGLDQPGVKQAMENKKLTVQDASGNEWILPDQKTAEETRVVAKNTSEAKQLMGEIIQTLKSNPGAKNSVLPSDTKTALEGKIQNLAEKLGALKPELGVLREADTDRQLKIMGVAVGTSGWFQSAPAMISNLQNLERKMGQSFESRLKTAGATLGQTQAFKSGGTRVIGTVPSTIQADTRPEQVPMVTAQQGANAKLKSQ